MFPSGFESLLNIPVKSKNPNQELADTSEVIYIAPQALLKMLKHCRSGIPMEVMGLMLGEFVDNYTIQVVDVFAMPQSGTGVAVEDIDPVYQSQMHEMLQQVGRTEIVVGWYHSHPGMGPFLSTVDQNTHQSFQQLHPRAVALVVDSVQSVKGKVVMEAFRLMEQKNNMFGQNEFRQTTSNKCPKKATTQALIYGLNRTYYSLNCEYKIGVYETQLLTRLKNKSWYDSLAIKPASQLRSENVENLKSMVGHIKSFTKQLSDEKDLSQEEAQIKRIGTLNHPKHILDLSSKIYDENVLQALCTMLMVSTMDQVKVLKTATNQS